jgi:hypothetical protein
LHFLAAAAIYVGTWGAVLLTSVSESGPLSVGLAGGASLVSGLVARAWSALALALVILPLAVMQPCPLECDPAVLLHAVLIWTPASAAVVALGVALSRRRAAA